MLKGVKSIRNIRIKNYINISVIIFILLFGVISLRSCTINSHNYVSEDLDIQIKNNVQEEVPVINNKRYLELHEDLNAEDAQYVFKNTEGLLKGVTNYPVRNDGEKVVYLTFDDGPSKENTKNILNVLDMYDIKATFFITGASVNKGQEEKNLLKSIAYNGHAIGNHSYCHDYKKLYPDGIVDVDVFMDDIEKTNEVLRSVLGEDFSTRIIRFPGGYWSWDGREEVRKRIDEKGYAIVDWNALNEDAQGKVKNADELVEVSKENVYRLGNKADSIVFLMHDTYGKSETVKALPRIIEFFKEEGFKFKTIK